MKGILSVHDCVQDHLFFYLNNQPKFDTCVPDFYWVSGSIPGSETRTRT